MKKCTSTGSPGGLAGKTNLRLNNIYSSRTVSGEWAGQLCKDNTAFPLPSDMLIKGTLEDAGRLYAMPYSEAGF